MNLIFAGSGEFGLPSLRKLLDSGHRVLQVITQPDRPAGRGRQLQPTPIGKFAFDAALPVIKTADINGETLPPADLLVVIAFGQKISNATIDQFPQRAVNLHASLLPRFRGAGPVNAAILSGDRETGNSIIRLAERMDAGAVLGQSRLAIGAMETAGELHDRLAADGAPLLLRVVDDLAAGRTLEWPQDESQVTKASKLTRESTRIDWSLPAAQIARQICGLFPWPGCQMELVAADSERIIAALTLVRAVAVAAEPAPPGRLRIDGTVATGAGAVQIVEVQPLGGRTMMLDAFQRGYRWLPGMRLRSRIKSG